MSTIRFIAGSGRSGTTWIQDAIAQANGLRPVFEPLHPWMSKIGERYAHRAIGMDESHPELAAFLQAASAGHGPRLWTQYRQQLRWLFPPPARFSTRKDAGRVARSWLKFLSELPRLARDGLRSEPLVKCIRANLMLPWIMRNLDCRVILVMRHPGAVVESELRSGWNAGYAIDRFRNDAKLHEITGGRYSKIMMQPLGSVESLTLRWVIENQWVAESAIQVGIPVFHYESLRSSDGRAWALLCHALDAKTVPDVGLRTRPSQQSGPERKFGPIVPSRKPRWMERLTAEQVTRIESVLDAVELDTYSMSDPLPKGTSPVAESADGTGTA